MARPIRAILVCATTAVAACTVSGGDGNGGPPVSSSTTATAACVSPTFPRWQPAPVGAATFPVNPSTSGMIMRVRWMLAPDSSALLVMDDPAAVENDPVPNGLLFATERTGRVFRMDSVWSAAPSPDWRQLAIGRAVVLNGGEAQSILPDRWAAPAARLRAITGAEPALVAESLRAHSFPTSGMGVAEGAAVTLVADVAHGAPTAPIEFVALDGWRVRWSCDGADILVGGRPAKVRDDAPSASERRVSSTGSPVTTAAPAAPPRWIDGFTIDLGAPGLAAASKSLVVRDRVIEQRGNRIVVRDRGASGADTVRDVGSGLALTATRGGHFILAIVPRMGRRRPSDPPVLAVVYRVP